MRSPSALFLSQAECNLVVEPSPAIVSREYGKGNAVINDALNTFYLRLYGVEQMVKDHSDSERKPAAAT